MRRVLWLLSFVTWFGLSSAGFAQDEGDEQTLEPGSVEQESFAEESAETETAAGSEATDADAPAAASGVREWWIGPFVEMTIVPSFLLNIFLAESPTVVNPAFGATVTHRNADGFSWILGLAYTSYGFDGPFRAKSDPELDTEYLESDLGLLHVRGQLMWSADITDKFAFEYGVGVELGFVLGSLIRSEAYRGPNGEYQPCSAPLTPDLTFCEPTQSGLPTDAYDAEGAHYNVDDERVPPIAGTFLLPALALRYTPIEQLQIKLEASFGLMQFSFGLSAAYGLGS